MCYSCAGDSMQFNTNYDDLCRQIKNVEEHFIDCTNANSSAAYFATYKFLVKYYKICTHQNLYNKKVNKNSYAKFSSRERVNVLYNQSIDNLIDNQHNHFNMISSIIDPFCNILNCFVNSKYYTNFFWKVNSVIPDDLGEDILNSFFSEYCPSMNELYEKLQKEKKIFVLPEEINRCHVAGRTFYNCVENDVMIFLNPQLPSLKKLFSLVHELAHAKDFLNYSSQHSSVDTFLYSIQSPFLEVPSFYDEFKFYDYLFSNSLFKDEVTVQLANELVTVSQFMDDLLCVSKLPEDYITWYDCMSKKLMPQLIQEQHKERISNPIFSDVGLENRDVDFLLAVDYSYGPLLSMAMSDDSKLYNHFSMIRDGYFDVDKLSSIGLSQENVSQKVMKKCDDFFGKYL